MRVKQLKEATMLCREAGVTAFVWGHRGVGKSSIIRQVCDEHQMGCIDLRCSQLEASDLRGLPDRIDGRTVFCPPEDMPRGGLSFEEYAKRLEDDPDNAYKLAVELQPQINNGILFLDELNRAQDDVIQAVFQLVLDRRLGQYALPPGWSVVVAGNYMEGYMTNGFTDAAFIDRFCHMQLSVGESTLEEWVNYMSKVHEQGATQVIEFASQNVKHLDGEVKGEMGFSVQPSRRSWEAVVRVEAAFKESKHSYSEDTRHAVLAGLLGWELATSYSRYNCPVRPDMVIKQGVKSLEGKLAKLNRNQLTGLMWGLASKLKNKVDEEKEGKIALDFVRWMCKHANDKDIAVAFCNVMVGGDEFVRERHAMISNPNIANLFKKYRNKDAKKTFIDRLTDDPELQELVSRTAWGKEK